MSEARLDAQKVCDCCASLIETFSNQPEQKRKFGGDAAHQARLGFLMALSSAAKEDRGGDGYITLSVEDFSIICNAWNSVPA
jgi:hypothetical protein